MRTVTAVIPNWNGRRLLPRVLEDLQKQSYPIATTIVVDNGSTDDSPALASQLGARVIQMGSNTGFARAVNRGILESRTPLVAILNNDVELDAAWLKNLAGALDREDAFFATGKIYSGRESGAGKPGRSVLDGAFDAICRGGCAWRCGNGKQASEVWDRPGRILSAPLTAALFRRDLFDKVGLLDEAFESYLEDVELGIRCGLAGFYGFYEPKAVAWHWGSATLGLWHGETTRRLARNQVYLLARHYPSGYLLRNGWAVLVANVLYGMLALRHGAGLSYLRGKWEGIGNFSRMRGKQLNLKAGRLAALLSESEARIHGLQRASGFDLYWRLYFLLTRGRRA